MQPHTHRAMPKIFGGRRWVSFLQTRPGVASRSNLLAILPTRRISALMMFTRGRRQPGTCGKIPYVEVSQIPFGWHLGDYRGLPLLRLPPDTPPVVLGQPPALPGPLPAPAPGRAPPPLELPPAVLCRAPVLVPPPLLPLPLVPPLPMTYSSEWRPCGRAAIVVQPYQQCRKRGI